MEKNAEWLSSEFANLEMQNRHRRLESEYDFYEAISGGDMEAVRENCESRMFTNLDGVGVLSKDPLRNMKYHYVVTAAMIARYCIQKGMGPEEAYSLSDFYILKADDAGNIESLNTLHDEMCYDYCARMKELSRQQIISKPIVLCVDYIYSHLHYRITIDELAENLGITASYLSRLFKKEMGICVSDYINKLKIEQAKTMLQYSNKKIIDISNYLSFSSQSHFIGVFKKITGMTPYKYRQLNFKTTWEKGDGENKSAKG